MPYKEWKRRTKNHEDEEETRENVTMRGLIPAVCLFLWVMILFLQGCEKQAEVMVEDVCREREGEVVLGGLSGEVPPLDVAELQGEWICIGERVESEDVLSEDIIRTQVFESKVSVFFDKKNVRVKSSVDPWSKFNFLVGQIDELDLISFEGHRPVVVWRDRDHENQAAFNLSLIFDVKEGGTVELFLRRRENEPTRQPIALEAQGETK